MSNITLNDRYKRYSPNTPKLVCCGIGIYTITLLINNLIIKPCLVLTLRQCMHYSWYLQRSPSWKQWGYISTRFYCTWWSFSWNKITYVEQIITSILIYIYNRIQSVILLLKTNVNSYILSCNTDILLSQSQFKYDVLSC